MRVLYHCRMQRGLMRDEETPPRMAAQQKRRGFDRPARNRLGKIVQKAMKTHPRKETEEGCESASGMWSKCRCIRSRESPTAFTNNRPMRQGKHSTRGVLLHKWTCRTRKVAGICNRRDHAARNSEGYCINDVQESTLHLRSVRNTVVVKEAQKQWATSWNKDEAGRGLYALQPTPKTTVLKLHDGLTKGGANKDREDRSSPVFARH